MKIKVSQATWLEYKGRKYGPGDVLDIDDSTAAGLINAHSAEEVGENAYTKSRNSGKN